MHTYVHTHAHVHTHSIFTFHKVHLKRINKNYLHQNRKAHQTHRSHPAPGSSEYLWLSAVALWKAPGYHPAANKSLSLSSKEGIKKKVFSVSMLYC